MGILTLWTRIILFLLVSSFIQGCTTTNREQTQESSNLVLSKEFFFETIMDTTISTSTGAKDVNLQGFKDFALLARFEGQPNKDVEFEIYYNKKTLFREKIKLNQQGWVNFAKVYPIYAPNVGITIYHPPVNLKVKMTIYAGH
jgi:hypothetical protein